MLLFALLKLRGGRGAPRQSPQGRACWGAKGCSPGCSGCSFYSVSTGSKLTQPVLVLRGLVLAGTARDSYKIHFILLQSSIATDNLL